MTGIREMFAELSGDNHDWFQMAFAFERTHDREKERLRYVNWKRDARPERKAYKAHWVTEYQKRKLRDDPEWAERRRKQKRESERRCRARKKAGNSCP